MKNISIRNRVVRTFASISIAATVTFILPLSQSRVAAHDLASVSSHHAVQLADGTESNGGKGGKGSSKLSRSA